MRSIKKVKNKKPLIALILIALLLAAGGLYIWFARPFNAQPSTQETTPPPVNSVDYSPATDQEKQASDEAKQKIVEQQDQQPNPPSAATMTVTIVRASQLSNGQPLNIRTTIEGATSGTCAATLTNGGQTVS